MIEWNNSNLWVKLFRICYAKIITQALPNLILESMICQFVKKYSNFCFVCYLRILDSSRCPGEKGRTFRKSKMSLWVHVIFLISKCSSFFTRRFLYIFGCCGPWCGGGGWSSRPPTPIFSYFSVKCEREKWDSTPDASNQRC